MHCNKTKKKKGRGSRLSGRAVPREGAEAPRSRGRCTCTRTTPGVCIKPYGAVFKPLRYQSECMVLLSADQWEGLSPSHHAGECNSYIRFIVNGTANGSRMELICASMCQHGAVGSGVSNAMDSYSHSGLTPCVARLAPTPDWQSC